MNPNCIKCGVTIRPHELGVYYGSYLCSNCYSQKAAERLRSEICTRCYRTITREEADRTLGKTLCKSCLEKEIEDMQVNICAHCRKRVTDKEKKRKTKDGRIMCLDCYRKTTGAMRLSTKVCVRCKKETAIRFITDEGDVYCTTCSVNVPKSVKREVGEWVSVKEERPVITKLRGLIKHILED